MAGAWLSTELFGETHAWIALNRAGRRLERARLMGHTRNIAQRSLKKYRISIRHHNGKILGNRSYLIQVIHYIKIGKVVDVDLSSHFVIQ